ncbi:hypothetical protein [Tindallia californiensis]|uniref:Uncharacterized protein n=1 Tax=Tindallia californiensis TaxID=159292 RepID=A0A1H3PRJ7_9FIRM|nr:hypothetical protein [Tindallia californiensis]SDZ03666.1 hypothetical protein SAMN05192546_10748 [Tindallia californiensis]
MRKLEDNSFNSWDDERKAGKTRFIVTIGMRNAAMITAGVFFFRHLTTGQNNGIGETGDISLMVLVFLATMISSMVGANYRWKKNEEGGR